MGISVTIKGQKELARKLDKYNARLRKNVIEALKLSALNVQGEAKRTIQKGSRSGRVYVRQGIAHHASAPGEPPKTDTGRLVSSIAFDVDIKKLEATVGTNLEYGKFLEFGTTNLHARPWLFPSFERLKPKISDHFNAAIKKTGLK